MYLFGDLVYKLEGTRLNGGDVYIALAVQWKSKATEKAYIYWKSEFINSLQNLSS